jgi:hypothetical protein
VLPVSSMCFATGRLIVASPSGHGDTTDRIHIMDYLLPSE